jgi:hypothetical protein
MAVPAKLSKKISSPEERTMCATSFYIAGSELKKASVLAALYELTIDTLEKMYDVLDDVQRDCKIDVSELKKILKSAEVDVYEDNFMSALAKISIVDEKLFWEALKRQL